MQVQVNTDKQVRGGADLRSEVADLVHQVLNRFNQRITRVEVQLSDESSRVKTRANDKRCVLEARLAGMKPISVSHAAGTVELAVSGAADKLKKTLSRILRRKSHAKGRTSYGGDQTI
jgi:ribosome-associated translation inhibitor RaiA